MSIFLDANKTKINNTILLKHNNNVTIKPGTPARASKLSVRHNSQFGQCLKSSMLYWSCLHSVSIFASLLYAHHVSGLAKLKMKKILNYPNTSSSSNEFSNFFNLQISIFQHQMTYILCVQNTYSCTTNWLIYIDQTIHFCISQYIYTV
jgi:hypothetical protein